MLDLPQTMTLFSPSSFQSIDVVDDVDAKFNATHLYYHKPDTVQIIQLVECPPPPRRIISAESSYTSSSWASSSYCSEEADESECSSYCSSVEPVVQDSSEPEPIPYEPAASSEAYNIRMKRILAWREDFSSHLSTTLSAHYFLFAFIDPSISSSLKRKISVHPDDDDVKSHTSKRSRSQSSQGEGTSSCSSLGGLSCPACDASFDTRQDLRQHGY
ncbi:hypothetical protein BT96DRAFT_347519 [Gymnopus androsaceus JB14]|uniref:Uncharacterized protein n=1 Tax=Gymnopus androsaceus JB14 TaxID=1447944 RepID=A0A6A4I3E9_9AGAR|nr:hypothetical protein BT96DRAFT_347519 [Gymnopus androsaceus JB14]